MKLTREQIHRKVIAKYGRRLQLMIFIEETAELIKEMIRELRQKGNTDKTIERIADAEIMVEQLKIIYNCHHQVEEVKNLKLARLNERIDNDSSEFRPI